jgi:hypothetical protein
MHSTKRVSDGAATDRGEAVHDFGQCIASRARYFWIIRRLVGSGNDEALVMKSRLKAFGLHFSGSACVLLLILGTFYFGWYRWPGWYLTGVLKVLPILVGVDLVLGPLMTFIIANPMKPSNELMRDVAFIVGLQLVALLYGCTALWKGRPLYYAFSVSELTVVQAMDIDPAEVELGRRSNPGLAPDWYSLPRWIWAPLPQDSQSRDSIVSSAIKGGSDVTSMPRYFKDWSQGLPELRKQLKKVDEWRYFSGAQQKLLKERMKEQGFAPDDATTLPMTGHGVPLLAVFDPKTLRIKALLIATS